MEAGADVIRHWQILCALEPSKFHRLASKGLRAIRALYITHR
jgi:hypothetical protein